MRDPNRIDPLMNKLATIWKEECPDWRFSQFIFNVFDKKGGLIFYTEDEDIVGIFEEYFNREENKNGKNRNNKS